MLERSCGEGGIDTAAISSDVDGRRPVQYLGRLAASVAWGTRDSVHVQSVSVEGNWHVESRS